MNFEEKILKAVYKKMKEDHNKAIIQFWQNAKTSHENPPTHFTGLFKIQKP